MKSSSVIVPLNRVPVSLPEVSGNCRWSSLYETRPFPEQRCCPDDTLKCELQRWVAGAAVGVHALACAFEFLPEVSGNCRRSSLYEARTSFEQPRTPSRDGLPFPLVTATLGVASAFGGPDLRHKKQSGQIPDLRNAAACTGGPAICRDLRSKKRGAAGTDIPDGTREDPCAAPLLFGVPGFGFRVSGFKFGALI